MTTTLTPPTITRAGFPYRAAFLPLAMEFVGRSASGFGLGQAEQDALVLAVEEVFSFYVDETGRDAQLELTMEDEGHQATLTLAWKLTSPDLRAFNLTHRVDLEDEASLATLGPMIASRSVTRLRVELGADDRVALRMTRERQYPPPPAVAVPPRPGGPAVLQRPSPDDLQHFGALASARGGLRLPPFLARPGMAAEMLRRGGLGALLACEGAVMTGGVCWRPLGEEAVEVFGPHLLYPDEDDATLALLLDAAIGELSRTRVKVLLRRDAAMERHERFFDFLGALPLAGPSGASELWPHYYRMLREESSGAVYADPTLAAFLEQEYRRLCLPRQLRPLPESGGRRASAHSVLSVDFEHGRSLATLRPLCAGRDMAENVDAHLRLLAREGFRSVVVELDTGRAEDTRFAPVLAAAGLAPRLVIPDAGLGDLVLFTA